jgi:hypothetical protein
MDLKQQAAHLRVPFLSERLQTADQGVEDGGMGIPVGCDRFDHIHHASRGRHPGKVFPYFPETFDDINLANSD